MGWMTAVDEHREGHCGQLSPNNPTVAEILKDNNYTSYISGKWHLALEGSYKLKSAKPNGSWSFERGFDESHAGFPDGGSYYKVNEL